MFAHHQQEPSSESDVQPIMPFGERDEIDEECAQWDTVEEDRVQAARLKHWEESMMVEIQPEQQQPGEAPEMIQQPIKHQQQLQPRHEKQQQQLVRLRQQQLPTSDRHAGSGAAKEVVLHIKCEKGAKEQEEKDEPKEEDNLFLERIRRILGEGQNILNDQLSACGSHSEEDGSSSSSMRSLSTLETDWESKNAAATATADKSTGSTIETVHTLDSADGEHKRNSDTGGMSTGSSAPTPKIQSLDENDNDDDNDKEEEDDDDDEDDEDDYDNDGDDDDDDNDEEDDDDETKEVGMALESGNQITLRKTEPGKKIGQLTQAKHRETRMHGDESTADTSSNKSRANAKEHLECTDCQSASDKSKSSQSKDRTEISRERIEKQARISTPNKANDNAETQEKKQTPQKTKITKTSRANFMRETQSSARRRHEKERLNATAATTSSPALVPRKPRLSGTPPPPVRNQETANGSVRQDQPKDDIRKRTQSQRYSLGSSIKLQQNNSALPSGVRTSMTPPKQEIKPRKAKSLGPKTEPAKADNSTSRDERSVRKLSFSRPPSTPEVKRGPNQDKAVRPRGESDSVKTISRPTVQRTTSLTPNRKTPVVPGEAQDTPTKQASRFSTPRLKPTAAGPSPNADDLKSKRSLFEQRAKMQSKGQQEPAVGDKEGNETLPSHRTAPANSFSDQVSHDPTKETRSKLEDIKHSTEPETKAEVVQEKVSEAQPIPEPSAKLIDCQEKPKTECAIPEVPIQPTVSFQVKTSKATPTRLQVPRTSSLRQTTSVLDLVQQQKPPSVLNGNETPQTPITEKTPTETDSPESDSTTVASTEEGIRVAVRMRPLNDTEEHHKRVWEVFPQYSSVTQTTPEGRPLREKLIGRTFFTFDRTFSESNETRDVYSSMAKGIVRSVVAGLNGVIFTYGQTSSGKTYTMQGAGKPGKDEGILQMAASDIFRLIEKTEERLFLVRVSFLEIYNEEIRDLLAKGKEEKLAVREDPQRGFFVPSREEIVINMSALQNVLFQGNRKRSIAATAMNERSSRSHTVFRITVESRARDQVDCGTEQVNSPCKSANGRNNDAILVSTLDLVDLAGSESVRHTGAKGDRQKEGGMINQSLLTLSRVIVALGSSNRTHINFRDSKLTRILQPSLSGNARMAVICCATPSELYLEETRSTLAFAARAKLVTTNPIVNEVLDDRSMIRRLQKELIDARRKAGQREVLERRAAWADSLARATEGKMGKLHRVHAYLINSGILSFKSDTHEKKRVKRRYSDSADLEPISLSELENLPKETPQTLTPGRKRARTKVQTVAVTDYPLLHHALACKTNNMKTMKERYEDACQKMKTLQATVKSQEKMIKQKDEELQKLMQRDLETAKTRLDVQTLEQAIKSQAEIIKQQNEEVRRLQEKDADMAKVRIKFKTLQDTIKTQKETIQKNEEELQKRKKDMKALENARDLAKKEVEATKQKLEGANGEHKLTIEKLDEMAKSRSERERESDEEIQKLTKELESVKAEHIQTKTKLECITKAHEESQRIKDEEALRLKNELEHSILERGRMSARLDEMTQARHEMLQQNAQERQKAKNELDHAQMKNDRMSMKISEIKQAQSQLTQRKDEEIRKLHSELEDLQNERDCMNTEHEERSQSLSETLWRRDQEIHRLENELDSFVSERDRLNADRDEMARNHAATLQRKDEEINRQANELEAVKRKHDRMCTKFEETTHSQSDEINQLHEDIHILQETVDTAVREQGRTSSNLDEAKDALRRANEDYDRLVLDHKETLEKLEDVQRQHEEVMAQKEEALVACDGVNALMEDIVASLEKAEASNELLSEELQTSKSQNELLVNEIDMIGIKLKDMKRERDLLASAVDRLMSDFKEQNESADKLRKDKGNDALKVEKTRIEEDSLLNELEGAAQGELESEGKSRVESIINEKLGTLKRDFNEADYERLVLRDSITALEEELREVRAQLRATTGTTASLRQREQALNKELEEIQTICVSLSAVLIESESSRNGLMKTRNERRASVDDSPEKSAESRDKRVESLLGTVVSAMEGTLRLEKVENTFKAQMVGQLAALIQVLYHRMERETVLGQTQLVMDTLLQGLSVRNAEEEVFMAIGSIVYCLEDSFAVYMNAFVPLLLRGLQRFEQGSLGTICTGVVIDLCGSVGALIQPHADEIMKAMFQMIKNGFTKDRDVQAAVISCFGEMALSIGAAFKPYMEPTMMVLMQASQEQVTLHNEDMIAFTNKLWGSVFAFPNKLRSSVLEAYSSIIVGLAESRAVDVFVPHATNVLMFLRSLASDNTKDDAVLQNAVALLGDIARELGDRPEIRIELQSEFAKKLIDEAAQSDRVASQEKAQWAKDAMERKPQPQDSLSTSIGSTSSSGGLNSRRKSQLQQSNRSSRRN
ncbi:hypothetical protein ACA910_017038 [Epithemia clementina (nom. ined.)]